MAVIQQQTADGFAANIAGAIFAAVIVGAFEQQRIGEYIAQAQVNAYRRGGIG